MKGLVYFEAWFMEYEGYETLYPTNKFLFYVHPAKGILWIVMLLLDFEWLKSNFSIDMCFSDV